MAWVGEYLKTNLIIMLQPPATSSQMTSTQMTMTTFQPELKEISMATEEGEPPVLLLEKDLGNEAIGHTVPWSTSKNYFLFSLSEQTNNSYCPSFLLRPPYGLFFTIWKIHNWSYLLKAEWKKDSTFLLVMLIICGKDQIKFWKLNFK